jgi:hypothetical protein
MNHFFLVRTIAITVLWLPVGNNTVLTKSAQIQRVFSSSPRLRRRLLTQAQDDEKNSITIEEDLPSGSIFNGSSTVVPGGFHVSLSQGLSDTFIENLIAHELFHIYLRRDGFKFDTARIPRTPQLAVC